MNIITRVFYRIKLYFQAKKFVGMLEELHDILAREGTILAYGQFCLIEQNILDDYKNREDSASFIIGVLDYLQVYIENPEQYKGNRQMEVRVGLMQSIYVLLLTAMGELDAAIDAMEENVDDDNSSSSNNA